MNSNHPDGVTLDDYVDNALPAGERAVVDAHLATCAECRELVAGLRAVINAVSQLTPPDPPPAAWTHIERTIRGRSAARRISWTWLAAAAALVIATVTGLRVTGIWPRPSTPATVALAPANDAQAVEAEFSLALQHYQNAVSGLERIARSETGELDPQTASTLEKNLAVVDQAIGESRAALKAQPDSEPAQQSLLESFKSKIALLQDTVALINEMRKGNEAGTARVSSGLKQRGN